MANPFAGLVQSNNTPKTQHAGDALIPVMWKYAQSMSKVTGKPAVDFYKLLMETANQESHFGIMSKNIMQLTSGTINDLNKRNPKLLKDMGVSNFDINNPDNNIGFAAAIYLNKIKDNKINVSTLDLSTQENRAKIWKKLYNSYAPSAAGTPEKYLGTNSMMDWTKTDDWWKQINAKSI